MATFQELIQSSTPVLVDFYADWCAPCKAMAPAIEEVASEAGGKARVIKVNIDRNEKAAMKYGIQAVPTFVIFKNGQVAWRHSGMIDKTTLLNRLLSFS